MKTLYEILGIDGNKIKKKNLAHELNLSTKLLDYYNDNSILPTDNILRAIEIKTGISKFEIMLNLGAYNSELKEIIAQNSKFLYKKLNELPRSQIARAHPDIALETEYGRLYRGDCLDLLSHIDNDTFDLVFADPPFNLKKLYPSLINDNLHPSKYIAWCEIWLEECIRTLKEGGSLFIWNLPKWNTYLAEYLNKRLTFRNWITVDIKYSLPISGRLYPAHYSLLYYVKGEKPKTFRPDRLPMEVCAKCFHEIKDYGGYKNKMNPLGISLSDVWYDIPPVRHSKHKARQNANELSIKLIDRIIELSTNVNDLIFDPFGGSGTTYITAELKERHWMGIEIGPIDDIINRFNNISIERELLTKYRQNYNSLFPPFVYKKREEKGLWTCDSFK